jgi:hypothetical protein
LTNDFTQAVQEALSGLEKITVTTGELRQALLQGGSPATPEELRQRFDALISEHGKGKDGQQAALRDRVKEDNMLIKSLKLTNFLSFGESAQALELRPLNVVIAPNGSGKSNLIEAIGLFQATPKDMLTSIRDGGGVCDWLWKGAAQPAPTASINAVLGYPAGKTEEQE